MYSSLLLMLAHRCDRALPFGPRFWATFRPGISATPLADLVRFLVPAVLDGDERMVLDDFRRYEVFGGLHGLDAPTLYVLELRPGIQGGDQVVAAVHHEEVGITVHARNGAKARAPPVHVV